MRYSLDLVIDTLREVCKKYTMTRDVVLKKIRYVPSGKYYLVTTADKNDHIIDEELLEKYVKSFGEKGGLEIAGNLMHSVELEQSAPPLGSDRSDEYWEGDLDEVKDYLKKKEEGREHGPENE